MEKYQVIEYSGDYYPIEDQELWTTTFDDLLKAFIAADETYNKMAAKAKRGEAKAKEYFNDAYFISIQTDEDVPKTKGLFYKGLLYTGKEAMDLEVKVTGISYEDESDWY